MIYFSQYWFYLLFLKKHTKKKEKEKKHRLLPLLALFIPCHMLVAGYFGIKLVVHMSVCPSVRLSIFSFPYDNLSKCQWIFTKLDACIDVVEIWFGIANGQIS